MKLTKEVVLESYRKFVTEFGRMPTKGDCRTVEYLPSANSIRRLTGTLKHEDILRDVYLKAPKLCAGCSCSLEFNDRSNKFCSQSCAATFNNKLKPKRLKAVPVLAEDLSIKGIVSSKVVKKCWYCFKILEKTQKTYCSLTCHADHKFMSAMCRWIITGKVLGGNKALRKYITSIEGYKCVDCGRSDWNDKPLTLEVEHKSGNSRDDSRLNTCLICPNCHSQTSTYKGRNRGNGRHFRMIRYYSGKSF